MFAFDYAAYFGLVVAAFSPLPLVLSLGFGVLAGLFIGNLFTLAHEGAHQSLTDSKALNLLLARLAFLPAMHALSLWIPGHNHTHHAFTNLRGVDYTWEPMSPEDYRRASPFARARYRLYRSAVGALPYYFFEIWLARSVLPLAKKDRAVWRRHALDAALVFGANAALAIAVTRVAARITPERSAATAVLLGWAIPFLVWNWIIGVVVFIQHTHPEIGWYETRETWSFYRGQIEETAEARLPPVMDTFSNQVMKHRVHHAAPTIPFYRLARAEARLRAAYPATKALMITPVTYLRHVPACKLFDYRRRCWTDFDGRATGPVIPLDGHVAGGWQ